MLEGPILETQTVNSGAKTKESERKTAYKTTAGESSRCLYLHNGQRPFRPSQPSSAWANARPAGQVQTVATLRCLAKRGGGRAVIAVRHKLRRLWDVYERQHDRADLFLGFMAPNVWTGGGKQIVWGSRDQKVLGSWQGPLLRAGAKPTSSHVLSRPSVIHQ